MEEEGRGSSPSHPAIRPGEELLDEEEEDPSLVILNPFCWAKAAEEQQTGRLTVRPSPDQAQQQQQQHEDDTASSPWPPPVHPDEAERGTTPGSGTHRLASQGSSGSSYSRRPLVKQRNYCHSAEDLTGIIQPPVTVVHPPTSCTPAASSDGASSPVLRLPGGDGDSHHHLRPGGPAGSSSGGGGMMAGGGGGLRQESTSVESRASSSPAPPALARPASSTSHGLISQQTMRKQAAAAAAAGLSGSIEDGAQLPAAFEPVPTHLYGKPLQEIDPTVRDKVRDGRNAHARTWTSTHDMHPHSCPPPPRRWNAH